MSCSSRVSRVSRGFRTPSQKAARNPAAGVNGRRRGYRAFPEIPSSTCFWGIWPAPRRYEGTEAVQSGLRTRGSCRGQTGLQQTVGGCITSFLKSIKKSLGEHFCLFLILLTSSPNLQRICRSLTGGSHTTPSKHSPEAHLCRKLQN